jgi:hypothetical protein
MKKILLGLVIGGVIGAAAVWLAVDHEAGDAKPAGGAKAEEKHEAPPTPATLTKEQLASAHLATAAPKRVSVPAEAPAYGRVLDPAPLIALVTEVAAAEATLAASEKELDRVRRLHAEGENASAQAVEAAEFAAQRDRVQLLSAKTRLTGSWGAALAAKADLKFVSDALAHGWAIVRIDLPSGETPSAAPTDVRVGPLTAEAATAPIEVLGPAPVTDPQLQGGGYLGLWREHALPPGATLRATLTLSGEPQQVLMLPRAAFVRHEGGVWVYVETKSGSYERRRVELARPLPEGYAIASGVDENDRVVIEGAQQLLSTELQAAGGEEP